MRQIESSNSRDFFRICALLNVAVLLVMMHTKTTSRKCTTCTIYFPYHMGHATYEYNHLLICEGTLSNSCTKTRTLHAYIRTECNGHISGIESNVLSTQYLCYMFVVHTWAFLTKVCFTFAILLSRLHLCIFHHYIRDFYAIKVFSICFRYVIHHKRSIS